ncbi:MAG: hypothetical protein WC627_12125 [Legionella sp.]|jgi:hypothetical protein
MTTEKREKTIKGRYINAFKGAYEAHLGKSKIPGVKEENHPADMIDQATPQETMKSDGQLIKTTGELSKLSRLFDSMLLPTLIGNDDFKLEIDNAGGIEAYCYSILNELAPILLNEQKNGLSEAAIKAIGRDRYENLIGTDLFTPGNEQQRAKREAEIARQVLITPVIRFAAVIGEEFSKAVISKQNELDKLLKSSTSADVQKVTDDLKKLNMNLATQNINVLTPLGKVASEFQLSMIGKKPPQYNLEKIEAKAKVLKGLVEQTIQQLNTKLESTQDPKASHPKDVCLLAALKKLLNNLKDIDETKNMLNETGPEYINDKAIAINKAVTYNKAFTEFAKTVSELDLHHNNIFGARNSNIPVDVKENTLLGKLIRFIYFFFANSEVRMQRKIDIQLTDMLQTLKEEGAISAGVVTPVIHSDTSKNMTEKVQNIREELQNQTPPVNNDTGPDESYDPNAFVPLK